MPDSRRLEFEDNGEEVMKEFRAACTIMTNLKIYIEQLCKRSEKIDSAISSYLKQTGESESLVFRDKSFNERCNIEPILGKLRHHEHLQRLTLSNCGIGDYHFETLLTLL